MGVAVATYCAVDELDLELTGGGVDREEVKDGLDVIVIIEYPVAFFQVAYGDDFGGLMNLILLG